MMLEASQAAKHNAAICKDCYAEWSGPQAFVDGAFHEQTTKHAVEFTARVTCHDDCCEGGSAVQGR